jgi:hypothetical protein
MPVISVSIPSMVNGVSQQPAAVRLTSQCELLENAYSSPVKGVLKRMPFRHLAKLSSGSLNGAYVHTINRDGTELYAVIITNGNLQVWSLVDGTQKTVTFASGTGYLTSSNPKHDFVAMTVADFTFVANRTVTCAMTGAVTSTRPHEAMFYVRESDYATTYQIQVNGTSVQYTTSSTDPTTIPTTVIAGNLAGSLGTALGAGWSVGQFGSVVYVQNTSTDFTITSSSSAGDTAIIAVKDALSDYSSLPASAVDGFVVKITGNNLNPYLGYYVQYQGASAAGGEWVEVPGPGVHTTFDASTMPHQLVRNADGTFTFQQVDWDVRGAGDENSIPTPSFVGNTINNLMFYQNRFGVLSGEHPVWSENDSYFNFWQQTATQLIDTDPIDVGGLDARVSILWASCPFAGTLLLFSKLGQFQMSSGGAQLSPSTVSISPLTTFENLVDSADPIFTGRVVYFAIDRGGFIGLRELGSLANNYQTADAPEITDHVPQYIPSGIFKLATSTTDYSMAVLTTGDPSSIYFYKWFFSGDQKVQSAWSKWTFPSTDTVLNVDFIATKMYAVIQRADGVYLEFLDLQLGAEDTGFTFQVNLDRLIAPTGTYNAGTNTTTWTLPYAETNTLQVVLGSTFGGDTGTVLTTQQPTTTTITAIGDFSAGSVFIGRPYTWRYRFSTQYVREYVKGGGFTTVVANLDSRLQLNKMYVVYEATGYLRAEVTPTGRDTYEYVFTGREVGLADCIIGAVATPTGRWSFPILARNDQVQIDLVNDTYLPSRVQACEWQGKFYTPSQRM